MAVSQAELLQAKVRLTIEYHFGLVCDKTKDDSGIEDEVARILKLTATWIHFCSGKDVDPFIKNLRELLLEIRSQRSELLRKEIRNQGNHAIRVIHAHIDHCKIVRRHNRDTPNIHRIASHLEKEDNSNGS